MNSAFPSRKMRDCELAHTFCFWKLFRTFTGKMTRGLSLRMVFSLLFQDTLLCSGFVFTAYVCNSILSNIITTMFGDVLHCFCFVFVWCPCMAINNASVQYNGGLLPDIILLTQCYYHRGTRLNAMKRFCICSL